MVWEDGNQDDEDGVRDDGAAYGVHVSSDAQQMAFKFLWRKEMQQQPMVTES